MTLTWYLYPSALPSQAWHLFDEEFQVWAEVGMFDGQFLCRVGRRTFCSADLAGIQTGVKADLGVDVSPPPWLTAAAGMPAVIWGGYYLDGADRRVSYSGVRLKGTRDFGPGFRVVRLTT